MVHLVHPFDEAVSAGDALSRLGGKGAGLAAMTRLGIPVPPGFTIPPHTAVNDALREAVRAALEPIEAATGRRFGGVDAPLLLSVRSGAAASMPGMMDTVLNIGLTTESRAGLARSSGDPRFALDAHRRLLQMFGSVVMGVSAARFETSLSRLKARLGQPRMLDSELSADALSQLVADFEAILLEDTGRPMPSSPEDQLFEAIEAVFRSWNNARAQRYRRMQGIPDSLGTACTVQAMVFGNLGFSSGSGVAFTRNPSTGEPGLYGEYLPNAQGEDVVSGVRTPAALTAATAIPGRESTSLERAWPAVFEELRACAERLELHFHDVQELEFTVEEGKLFMLQTRAAKRTARAGVKIAVDLEREGRVTRDEALALVDPGSIEQLFRAQLPSREALSAQGIEPLAVGLPASAGAASGAIVFDADDAVRAAAQGREVILVRRETSPEDIHGMKAAVGVLTATGGMTSHAAVVARGLGKTCVAGCSSATVDYANRTLSFRPSGRANGNAGVVVLHEGDELTLDGSAGTIYSGALELVPAASAPELELLLGWADEVRQLEVRANVDTPRAARLAARLGAEGVGLCCTEASFFAEGCLLEARAMLLAGTEGEGERRARSLARRMQPTIADILRAMPGKPVAIRLFDWPVHELIPRTEEEVRALALELGIDELIVSRRLQAMNEKNPLLGNRGARLGLTQPLVYRAQVRAILGAALEVAAEGLDPRPELLIPIVSAAEELRALVPSLAAEAQSLFAELGQSITYRVGVILELPRACLVAADLARYADFFTFGTNDLTQTTFGISRDDAASFLSTYVRELGVFEADPFSRLDREGVGRLIELAVESGRNSDPALGLGMCGDHGGEPDSIAFCASIGMDHVSCSPARLPIARLAAAQAALRLRSAP